MTVPVPLTDIIGCSDADTRDRGVAEWRREHGRNVLALCEALRIAVEGLEECGRYERPAVPRGYTHVDALAAVRELVDLGGDDG